MNMSIGKKLMAGTTTLASSQDTCVGLSYRLYVAGYKGRNVCVYSFSRENNNPNDCFKPIPLLTDGRRVLRSVIDLMEQTATHATY
jgi:hypothetical protein